MIDFTEAEPAFFKFVEALAVHDYHYNTVNNGYKEGSKEHEVYQKQIDRLKELDDE